MTSRRTQLHVFPTFAMGGAQRRFLQLAANLPDWQHVVVALDGVDSARLALPSDAPVAFDTVVLRKSSGVSLANQLALRALLNRVKPDILCTYNWGSTEMALANLLVGHPHIHFEDGFGPEEASGRLRRRNAFRTLALRRAHVVVPSSGLQQIAVTEWRVPPARCQWMVNGVDTQRFRPAAVTAAATRIRVGTVGALRAEKNFSRLIDAIAACHEKVELIVVGDGTERVRLEAHAAALGVSTKFLGNVPDPSTAYHNFDIFALSSDTEQMPLTVLEAMAAGLPVVATDVGDVKKMVCPDNIGFIIPLERAAAALPAAIDALAHDAARRTALGRANRQRAVETFDLQKMVTTYATLFERVAANR